MDRIVIEYVKELKKLNKEQDCRPYFTDKSGYYICGMIYTSMDKYVIGKNKYHHKKYYIPELSIYIMSLNDGTKDHSFKVKYMSMSDVVKELKNVNKKFIDICKENSSLIELIEGTDSLV